MGCFACPKNPFLKGGSINFWTAKDVRVPAIILEIHNFSPDLIITKVTSIDPGSKQAKVEII